MPLRAPIHPRRPAAMPPAGVSAMPAVAAFDLQPAAASALQPAAASALQPAAASALHGQLTSASEDLDRLQTLLADACAELLRHFDGAAQHVHADLGAADTATLSARCLAGVKQHLAGAVTALQFQDLASQLIAHTSHRLRDCAAHVAGVTADRPLDTHLRDTPVAQAGMGGGSVELF